MQLDFREAHLEDIPSLVKMLSDDDLGELREDPSTPTNQRYLKAFFSIEKDPNNELTVVESSGEIIGMMQLTYIPYLTYIGSWRCLVEGVRINSKFRGRGLGTRLLRWAIARAKDKHCTIVQLTSDKQRPDALRFYEDLGFNATHEGFKLKI